MVVTLSTNLAELPTRVFTQLASCLNSGDLWMKVLDSDRCSVYYFSDDEVERHVRSRSSSETLLRLWGNRGQTVEDFLRRLQALGRVHGSVIDRPQLVLGRKFKAVRWSRPDQEVVVSLASDGLELNLECKAVGFPSPSFQWLENDRFVEGGTQAHLRLPRCKCSLRNSYKCQVANEVEEGADWATFYRQNKKQFASKIESAVIELRAFIGEEHECERCKKKEFERICEMIGDMNNEADEVRRLRSEGEEETETLIAADKVALIISNSSYVHLPPLITPHCDAETLALTIQDLRFKTITLADLTLEEMKTVIREYRKLLGNGVYAIFYFVGHGFEVNGQCYLLPIDAPVEGYTPHNCLSMDWVLQVLGEYTPALNLVLLDVCRKYIPASNATAFIDYAAELKMKQRLNKNTVFGFATSGGVSAYEVKGEVNGVFMKYLKNHLTLNVPVVDMLHRVLRDIDKDSKVCDLQVPELRILLPRPRSLCDELVYDGHTLSYDHHTLHWRLMHELPNPVYVKFKEEKLTVTVWFDFCGHFTNKVYVFSSVGDLVEDEEEAEQERQLSERALSHLAYLTFPKEIETSSEKILEDSEEGISLCMLLSNLQRSSGEIPCTVELKQKDVPDKVVARRETNIGHVLITRLGLLKERGIL